MAKTASLPDVNQMDEDLKAVLHRLTFRHTTSMVGYTNRLKEVAEEHLVTFADAEARLVELLRDQLQPLLAAGRFRDVRTLLCAIPSRVLASIDQRAESADNDAPRQDASS